MSIFIKGKLMRYLAIFVSTFFLASSLFAQNLLNERIWKISSRKRSIFFETGVFHSDLKSPAQKLKSVRNSFIPARGYERIVFDFSSDKAPRVYGHISREKSKVSIDFYDVQLMGNVSALQNNKYIKNVNFFTIDQNNLSAELNFVKGVSYDIFYLEKPGRIVIDVKK